MSFWGAFSSEYCALPEIWTWLDPLDSTTRWTQKYNLIDLQILENTSNPPFNLSLRFNDAHMCNYGWSFLAESITGMLLAVVALVTLVWLQYSFPYSHHQRKLLFALLATTGLIRGIYNGIISHKVNNLKIYYDLIDMIPWFFKTMIPVNSVADLLVAFIDFLLTFFWLDIMYHRFVSSRFGIALQVFLFSASSIALCVTTKFDYDDIFVHDDYNGGNVYSRSISYLVVLLLFSGLLHVIVVAMLLNTMFRVTNDISIFLDPKMRSNVTVVALIGFVSAACLVIRAAVLMGRVLWIQSFVNGMFSLDNPTFTTIYYIVMMNLPCIVVSVAFSVLSFRLVRDEERTRVENEHTRESLLHSQDGSALAAAAVRVGPRTPLIVGNTYRKQAMRATGAGRQSMSTSSATGSSANKRVASPSQVDINSDVNFGISH